MESQRKKVSLPFLSTGLYVFHMVLISWENLHMLGGHFTCSDDLYVYVLLRQVFFGGNRSQLQVIVVYKQAKQGHLALTPY